MKSLYISAQIKSKCQSSGTTKQYIIALNSKHLDDYKRFVNCNPATAYRTLWYQNVYQQLYESTYG